MALTPAEHGYRMSPAAARCTLPPDQIIPATVARRLQRIATARARDPQYVARDPQGDAADARALHDYHVAYGIPAPGPESADVVPWAYRPTPPSVPRPETDATTTTNPLDDHRRLYAEITVREYGEPDRDEIIGPFSPYDPDATGDDCCAYLENTLRAGGDDPRRVWIETP